MNQRHLVASTVEAYTLRTWDGSPDRPLLVAVVRGHLPFDLDAALRLPAEKVRLFLVGAAVMLQAFATTKAGVGPDGVVWEVLTPAELRLRPGGAFAEALPPAQRAGFELWARA